MPEFVRPAPDLGKIAETWTRWTAASVGGPQADNGDDPDPADVLPGRTMADLKIAGVDKVIETIATDNPEHREIGRVAQVWDSWERGRTGPAESLAGLAAAGFDQIVNELSSLDS